MISKLKKELFCSKKLIKKLEKQDVGVHKLRPEAHYALVIKVFQDDLQNFENFTSIF